MLFYGVGTWVLQPVLWAALGITFLQLPPLSALGGAPSPSTLCCPPRPPPLPGANGEGQEALSQGKLSTKGDPHVCHLQ